MTSNGADTPSPSRLDAARSGVAAAKSSPMEKQTLRAAIARCQFVRRCAQSLLLDTTTTATAIVLSQQFYALRSEEQFDHRVIGGACLFLATKTCEVPRTLRSIVNVVHAVMNDTTKPLHADDAYANLKNSLINAEQTVLRVLRFGIDVVLPHPFLLNYAHHLHLSEPTTRCALALVHDVLCAPASLRFPAPVLAAACLLLASRTMQEDAPFESDSKWWYQYDASDEDMQEIALVVARIQEAMAQ